MAAGYRNDASTDSIRNPDADVNIQNSLSEENISNDIAPLPGNIYGKDVALEENAPEDDIAPVAENATTTEMFPDDLAPVYNAPMAISKKETTTKTPMYDIFSIKKVEGAGTAATTTTNNNIAPMQPNVNIQNSLSEENISKDIAPMSGNIYGKDVALEEKAPMAGDTKRTAAAVQARREVVSPTPEDIAQIEMEREDGRIPLPEDIALMEQRQLDEEYRQRMGEDPTIYDTETCACKICM